VTTAWREQHVPLGFAPEHLLTMNVRYPVAAPYVSPLGIKSEGRPVPSGKAEGMWGVECSVTPDYFAALGVRLLRGRALSEADTLGRPKGMVVNETMAREFLGGLDRALGRRIITNPGVGRFVPYDVVGVISDARFWTRSDVGPQMYTSFNQAVDDAYNLLDISYRLEFWVRYARATPAPPRSPPSPTHSARLTEGHRSNMWSSWMPSWPVARRTHAGSCGCFSSAR
jgi:MacB-like protein